MRFFERHLRGYGKRTFLHSGRILRVADFETNEASNADLIAELAGDGLQQLTYGDSILTDEGLLQKTNLFVELAEAPFHDLVEHLFRFAFAARALLLNVALLVQQIR